MKKLIIFTVLLFALYPLAAGAQPNIPEYDTEPDEEVTVDPRPRIYQDPDERDERRPYGEDEEYRDRDRYREHRTYDDDGVETKPDIYVPPEERRGDGRSDRYDEPERVE